MTNTQFWVTCGCCLIVALALGASAYVDLKKARALEAALAELNKGDTAKPVTAVAEKAGAK